VTTIAIADPADGRLDDFRRLNDQRFRRRYEGDELFIAEGLVAVERLVDSGHRIRSLLVAPSRLDRLARLHHGDLLAAPGVPVYVADPAVIGDVVGFDLHRGVIAAADRRPLMPTGDLATSTRRLAVLEGLNDGENLGAIARAARAFGIDALLLDPTCADPYSRRAVRVSMGEILLLRVARATRWPNALRDLADAGFEIWAMTPDAAATDLWTLHPGERLAVVLGAEGPGLQPTTMAAATRRVRVPIAPAVDSLNVGHAAAVTFAAIAPRS
jgi:tRNA G18 (ribose-2'-O)-methylase SpoU